MRARDLFQDPALGASPAPPVAPAPADRLLQIRDEIRRLRAEEGRIRTAAQEGTIPLDGQAARIVLRSGTRRAFLRDRLPAAILADPALWETRRSVTVSLERVTAAPIQAQPDDDDIVLIEEWRPR